MGKWLAGFLVLACTGVWSQEVARPVVPMELQLRQVDAIDLLQMFRQSDLAHFALRPREDVRVDFHRDQFTPVELREALATHAGLRRVVFGKSELFLPECAPQVFPAVTLATSAPWTVNFDDLQAEWVLIILADSQGLELSAPDGFPDVRLSLTYENRDPAEMASILAGVLGVRIRIVGSKLEVRRDKRKAACAGLDFRWYRKGRVTDRSKPPADAPRFSLQDCGRVLKHPWSREFPCGWYESHALTDFDFRGYIKLTPRGARLAYIDPKVGSTATLAMPGDRLSDDFVAVTNVYTDEVHLAQYGEGDDRKPIKAWSVDYADGRPRERPPGEEDDRPHSADYLERYGLEDLLVTATALEDGKWKADILTVHGVSGRYPVARYLGPHWGKLVGIDADGITVEQVVPDGLGGYYARKVRLQRGVWYEAPRDVLRRRLAFPEIDTDLQRRFVNAAAANDVAALERLLAQGASINATNDGDTALSLAVPGKDPARHATVRWLLAQGARVDGFFGEGEIPPIGSAAFRGDLEMVTMLLDAGGDIDLATRRGWTPLYYAAVGGNVPLAQLLLRRSANPRKENSIGLTPYLQAAYSGHADLVRLFLRNGVGLEESGRDGFTMLYAAVMGSRLELARELLKLGANVNAMSRLNRSVLDEARKSGPEFEQLLLSRGARPGSELKSPKR